MSAEATGSPPDHQPDSPDDQSAADPAEPATAAAPVAQEGTEPALPAPPSGGSWVTTFGLRRWLLIALGAAAGVAVLAVVAVLVIGALTGDDVPAVGDCMTHSANPAEMEVVDCDSAEAAWRVIGNDGSWSEQAFEEASQEEVCQAFAGWDNALWLGERTEDLSGDGEVICLASTDPAAPTE